MPLRARLALLFSIATAIAIITAGSAFVHQLGDNLYDTLDGELRDRLADTAAQVTVPATGHALGPGVGLTQLRGPDGTLIASTPSAAKLHLSAHQRRDALTGTEFFTTELDGNRLRVLAAAMPVGNTRLIVLVASATDIADDAVERVQTALFVMGPLAVVLAGLAASILAAATLRPVERMRAEAASIGEHDQQRRLAVPRTRDEIAALGTTMNQLLDRLQNALGRERRFVADASHELRTPLAILRAELELAERPGRREHELRAAVSDAKGETIRLSNLVEDLLLLARADNQQPILRPVAIELDELLTTTTQRGRAKDRQPPVEIHCPPGLLVSVDPDRMLQALTNLLDNAIRYSPPDAAVIVQAHQGDNGVTTIDVLDSGPGLPAEFLPRAFARFQRAQEDRARDTGGTGLGLSIVQTVIEAHGGNATITNRPEGGTHASIQFPARRTIDAQAESKVQVNISESA
jgi:hypothetical protein